MTSASTSPIVEVTLPTMPPSKGEREAAAFRRMLPALLVQFPNEYVAIHDEQVIDHDLDDIRLIQRVHKQIGYVPIYVGRAADSAVPIRRRRYREIRGGNA